MTGPTSSWWGSRLVLARGSSSGGDDEPGGLGLGALEAGLGVGPVDEVPPGGDVVGAHVLVVEVVGVLPDVEQDDRGQAEGEVALLVVELDGDELGADGVPGEDGPARALDAGGDGGELLLEGVEGAEVLVDRGADLAGGPRRRPRGRGWSRRRSG